MSVRMGSITVESSVGFGLAMLGLTRNPKKMFRNHPSKKLFASAFYMSLKKIEYNNYLPSVLI